MLPSRHGVGKEVITARVSRAVAQHVVAGLGAYRSRSAVHRSPASVPRLPGLADSSSSKQREYCPPACVACRHAGMHSRH